MVVQEAKAKIFIAVEKYLVSSIHQYPLQLRGGGSVEEIGKF